MIGYKESYHCPSRSWQWPRPCIGIEQHAGFDSGPLWEPGFEFGGGFGSGRGLRGGFGLGLGQSEDRSMSILGSRSHQRQISQIFGINQDSSLCDSEEQSGTESGLDAGSESRFEFGLRLGDRLRKLVAERFEVPRLFPAERMILIFTHDEVQEILGALRLIQDLYIIPRDRWRENGLVAIAREYVQLRGGLG